MFCHRIAPSHLLDSSKMTLLLFILLVKTEKNLSITTRSCHPCNDCSFCSHGDFNNDDGLLEIAPSIETLPAAYFDSSSLYSAGFETPPLRTITETSTKTTQRLKTNMLPIVVDGIASHHTLTQTYNVKILVEATKTLPYEITPTKTFQDIQNDKEKVAADLLRQLLPGT